MVLRKSYKITQILNFKNANKPKRVVYMPIIPNRCVRRLNPLKFHLKSEQSGLCLKLERRSLRVTQFLIFKSENKTKRVIFLTIIPNRYVR